MTTYEPKPDWVRDMWKHRLGAACTVVDAVYVEEGEPDSLTVQVEFEDGVRLWVAPEDVGIDPEHEHELVSTGVVPGLNGGLVGWCAICKMKAWEK